MAKWKVFDKINKFWNIFFKSKKNIFIIKEGIELLCLIGLIFDACRYLQDNNNWEKAAWLAKLRLPNEEYIEVVKRWTDYLASPQIKNVVIISLNYFFK